MLNNLSIGDMLCCNNIIFVSLQLLGKFLEIRKRNGIITLCNLCNICIVIFV